MSVRAPSSGQNGLTGTELQKPQAAVNSRFPHKRGPPPTPSLARPCSEAEGWENRVGGRWEQASGGPGPELVPVGASWGRHLCDSVSISSAGRVEAASRAPV